MTEKSVDERLAFFAERELNPHYKRMFTDAHAELTRRQQRLAEAERLLRLSWITPSCDFDLEREVIAFIDPDGLGIRTPIRTPDKPTEGA